MDYGVFKSEPAVFAVENTYHIMVPVNVPALMWVCVGNEEYYDDSNGILRSDTEIHKMVVPMDELDKTKEYTICYRRVIDRKAYFSETGEICRKSFKFRPVTGDTVCAYQLADTHNMIDEPVNAAANFEKKYGETDFLILNGDIIENSQDIEKFDNIYEIASKITHGCKPIVFSRGNHDLRGICAEKLEDYTPCNNGFSYYSFRLGCIWGIVLDCGEDKDDTHAEYGNTICCHNFRKRETKYIENIVKNAEKEYLVESVKHRISIVHNPFTRRVKEPFSIEHEIYRHWAKMLRDDIKADVMISGHEHRLDVEYPNGELDGLGHPCPVVVGSKPVNNSDGCIRSFTGSGFIFNNHGIKVVFNDDCGEFYEEHFIEK